MDDVLRIYGGAHGLETWTTPDPKRASSVQPATPEPIDGYLSEECWSEIGSHIKAEREEVREVLASGEVRGMSAEDMEALGELRYLSKDAVHQVVSMGL